VATPEEEGPQIGTSGNQHLSEPFIQNRMVVFEAKIERCKVEKSEKAGDDGLVRWRVSEVAGAQDKRRDAREEMRLDHPYCENVRRDDTLSSAALRVFLLCENLLQG
jgi:hypothetical protein